MAAIEDYGLKVQELTEVHCPCGKRCAACAAVFLVGRQLENLATAMAECGFPVDPGARPLGDIYWASGGGGGNEWSIELAHELLAWASEY